MPQEKGSVRSLGKALELLELPPFAPQPAKAVRARTRDRERAPRRFKLGMVQILSYFTIISD